MTDALEVAVYIVIGGMVGGTLALLGAALFIFLWGWWKGF